MAGIPDVVIALRARTEELERDLRDARRQIKDFSESSATGIGKLSTAVGKVGAALRSLTPFAVAAGTAMAVLAKRTIDSASALVDAADALGVSTDKLQELRFAAGQSGVFVSALETALKFLGKNAADAAEGTGKAAAIFKKLKIDPSQFTDIGELFIATGKAIDGLGTQAEKTQARLALFGKSGNDVGRIFLNAGNDLDKAIAQFRELGIAIDEKALRSTEALGDKLEALSTVIGARFTQAIADNAANISALADFAFKAADGLRVLGDQFRSIESQSPGGQTQALLKQIDLRNRLSEIIIRMRKQGESTFLGEVPGTGLSPESGTSLEELQRLSNQARAEEERIRALIEQRNAPQPTSANAAARDTAVRAAPAAKQNAEAIRDATREAAQAQAFAQHILEERLQAEGKVTELIKLRFDAERAELEVSKLSDEQKLDALADLEVAEAAALNRAQDATEEITSQARQSATAVNEVTSELQSGIADSLGDLIVTGRSTFEQLGQDFLRFFVRIAIEKGVSAISDALASVGSNSGSSGLIGGVLGGLFGAADGAIVRKPSVLMAGEKGPEAIIPLSKLGGLGGGSGDIQIVIENKGTPLEVTNSSWEQRGRMRKLRLEVRQAVGESVAANDPLSRTFQTTFGLDRPGIRRG